MGQRQLRSDDIRIPGSKLFDQYLAALVVAPTFLVGQVGFRFGPSADLVCHFGIADEDREQAVLQSDPTV